MAYLRYTKLSIMINAPLYLQCVRGKSLNGLCKFQVEKYSTFKVATVSLRIMRGTSSQFTRGITL